MELQKPSTTTAICLDTQTMESYVMGVYYQKVYHIFKKSPLDVKVDLYAPIEDFPFQQLLETSCEAF